MIESQFNDRTRSEATPLPRPEFELLLALAGLRQFATRTAQTLAFGAIGARETSRAFRLALFAGDRAPDGHHKRAATRFYEEDESLSVCDDSKGEGNVNLGVLSNVQMPGLGLHASGRDDVGTEEQTRDPA